MNLFGILWWITVAWWVFWAVIAFVKKQIPIMTMLLAAGVLWAAFPWFIASEEPTFLLPLLLIPLLAVVSMVKIVNEYQRGVLFRLGRMRAVVEPGLNLIFPFGIDVMRKIDMRTFTIDVPKQEVITKDNVPVLVDAVVYFNVFDPTLAVNKVADYTKSTSLLSQTILRSVLGQHDLDEMLSKRAELGKVLKQLLDEATDPWGVKVTAVEIKAVELAETMKRAMARQAEAERERRAKIIAAEGELQASEKLTQAACVMATSPSALQLRYLQTLTEIAVEKNSTILFPLPMEILKYFDIKKPE
ncbi:MAG: slipin family protein [Rectinemataceae bacterium]|nr:slipin family protein [Rectinemataceae bacterium]